MKGLIADLIEIDKTKIFELTKTINSRIHLDRIHPDDREEERIKHKEAISKACAEKLSLEMMLAEKLKRILKKILEKDQTIFYEDDDSFGSSLSHVVIESGEIKTIKTAEFGRGDHSANKEWDNLQLLIEKSNAIENRLAQVLVQIKEDCGVDFSRSVDEMFEVDILTGIPDLLDLWKSEV